MNWTRWRVRPGAFFCARLLLLFFRDGRSLTSSNPSHPNKCCKSEQSGRRSGEWLRLRSNMLLKTGKTPCNCCRDRRRDILRLYLYLNLYLSQASSQKEKEPAHHMTHLNRHHRENASEAFCGKVGVSASRNPWASREDG